MKRELKEGDVVLCVGKVLAANKNFAQIELGDCITFDAEVRCLVADLDALVEAAKVAHMSMLDSGYDSQHLVLRELRLALAPFIAPGGEKKR